MSANTPKMKTCRSKSTGWLWESHFVNLKSQTNVYGLTVLPLPGRGCQVLVATLAGQMKCLEYNRANQYLRPSTRDIPFTYIPGDAEIISADGFVDDRGVVVGITFIMADGDDTACHNYLNIYTPLDADSKYNIDTVAQGWQALELTFIPYQLCHTKISVGESEHTVFLLSGNDKKIHLYKEDYSHFNHASNSLKYAEVNIANYFPEFKIFPSIVNWVDIMNLCVCDIRVSAVGCQDGHISVTVVSLSTAEIDKQWERQHDSQITYIKVFQCLTNQDGNSQPVHVLACSALEPAVVYWDIMNNGLEKVIVLPNSSRFDIVMCACVADIDWDGVNEILLGTYGQELLVYKLFSDDNMSSSSARSGETSGSAWAGEIFHFQWQRTFTQPVLAMEYSDITSDGVKELIITTLQGIHVMQHELEDAAGVCTARLRALTGVTGAK